MGCVAEWGVVTCLGGGWAVGLSETRDTEDTLELDLLTLEGGCIATARSSRLSVGGCLAMVLTSWLPPSSSSLVYRMALLAGAFLVSFRPVGVPVRGEAEGKSCDRFLSSSRGDERVPLGGVGLEGVVLESLSLLGVTLGGFLLGVSCFLEGVVEDSFFLGEVRVFRGEVA